jgi:signal transduction histidine kinase
MKHLLKDLRLLSEKELTNDIIIPLLEALHYRDVRYTHGSLECGVDLLFSDDTPFGCELCGAQVKAVSITGSKTDREGNVSELLNQASSALRASFLDPGDNTEKSLDKFFILTSGDISDVAEIELRNAVRSFGRTLRIINGHTLAKLVREKIGTYAREYFGRKEMASYLKHFMSGPIQGVADRLSGVTCLLRESSVDGERALQYCQEAKAFLRLVVNEWESIFAALNPEYKMQRLVIERTLVEPVLRRVVQEQNMQAFGAPKNAVLLSFSEVAPVSADAFLLSLAFRNLLDNALKYSVPGEPVKVHVSGGEGSVRIQFENTGLLIAAEDIPHLSEPFFRGEVVSSAAGYVRGIGMGLTVAQMAVAKHGGRIEVSSTRVEPARSGLGRNSFTIVLPIEPEPISR